MSSLSAADGKMTQSHREYHQIGKQAFERKHGVCFADEVYRLNQIWFQYSGMVK